MMGRFVALLAATAVCMTAGDDTAVWTLLGGGRVVIPGTPTPGRTLKAARFGVPEGAVTLSASPAALRNTARWAAPQEFPAGEPVHQAVAVDLNQDGRADMAAASERGVQLWLGTPDGLLRAGSRLALDGVARLAAADLDGDRHPDLIAATADGRLLFLRGDGQGRLQEAGASQTLPLATALLISDWNNDGIPDAAVAAEREIQLLEGDGHGHFAHRASLRAPGPVTAAAAADLDGDGRLDLVTARADAAELWWFRALGEPGEAIVLPSPAEAVGIFDELDAAHLTVRFAGDRRAWLLRNADRRGRFEPAVIAPGVDLETPEDLLADVNGDAALDHVQVNAAGSLTVTPRQAGSFTMTKTHSGTWTAGMQGGVFTIQVTGTGTPRITDTLPAGLTLVSMQGPLWECLLGSTTCIYGGAAPAGGVFPPLLVTVNVDANAPNVMTNVASEESGAQASDTVILGGGGGGGSPDLTLTKTRSGAAVRGGAVSYALTVTNTGGASSSGVITVTEQPGTGLTLTAMSGNGWNCDVTQRRCTTSASAAAGGSLPVITVTGTIAANAPATVNNFAQVSGGGETNTSNNGGLDDAAVPGPDLTVTKSHTGNFFQAQTNATFRITVRNVGAGPTDGPLGNAVVVNDTPANGLTLTALSGSGWTCVAANRTCSRSDVLAAGAAWPDITATFSVSASAPASLSNFVTVFGGGDNSAGNNTFEDVAAIDPSYADLTITKTHTGTFYRDQEDAQFTITISNVGIVPTVGTVTVTELAPPGVTGALSGQDWACSGTVCNYFGAIAPGGAAPPLIFRARIPGNAGANLTNSAIVSGGGDNTPGNNRAFDPFTVTSADLTISKTHTGNFVRGQTGTYTIVVRNLSTVAPTTYRPIVEETLPTGLTLSSMAGTNWLCSGASCTYGSGLAANGVTEPLIVTVLVAADAPAQVTNTARVVTQFEFNTSNDSASDPTLTGPDLRLTKTHTGNFYRQQGTGALYILQVTTTGTTSGRVTVVDTPPAGMTIVSMAGFGWTCTVSTRTCINDTVATPGAPLAQIGVNVSIAADAPASLTNTASVSGGGDADPGNNTASDPTTILPLDYNLAITKTHTGSPVAGGNVTYTITVRNVGGTAAAGTNPTVVMTEQPPAGLTITSLSASTGTCTLATTSCTASTSLAPNASITYTVNATIALTASSPLTNTATVQGSGDVNPNDNTAQDAVSFPTAVDVGFINSTLGPLPPLRYRDLANLATGFGGSAQVTNLGVAATAGPVLVQVTADPGIRVTNLLLGATACSGPAVTQCSYTDGIPGISSVDGQPQGGFMMNYTVQWDALAPQTRQVRFTLSTPGDSNLTNNTFVFEVEIVAPDLRVNKTHTGNFRQGQTGVTYQISVQNLTSYTSLGGFEVEELPPPGLIIRSMSGPGWNCAQRNLPLRCLYTLDGRFASELGPLATTAPITVVADVAADAPATLTNTARLLPTQRLFFDINPGNDRVEDVATVVPSSSMNVSVSQGSFTFNRFTNRYEQVLTITNLGANLTASAVVLDNLTNATLIGATGVTSAAAPAGSPYVETGPIATNQTIRVTLGFNRTVVAPITYNLRVLGAGAR